MLRATKYFLKRPLQLIECPRDAMQGLHDFVPTADKIRYINAVLNVGFHTVDCGSFVSVSAVPQMRDTAAVLAGLDLSNTKSKLLVVTCNVRGVEQACAEEKVHYVGYSLSASETFQQRNSNCSIQEGLIKLQQAAELCKRHGKELVTYVSMAFGNPYNEPHSIEAVDCVVSAVLECTGNSIISLADTVGVSTPELIKETFNYITPRHKDALIGAHFHTGAATSLDKVTAALEIGCPRLDSAIAGMGGCPFASSSLVGNVPTEAVVDVMKVKGLLGNDKNPAGTATDSSLPLPPEVPLNMTQLQRCYEMKHEIFGVAVKEVLLAKVLNHEKLFTQLMNKHFETFDVSSSGQMPKEQFEHAMREVFSELGEEPPTAEKINSVFSKYRLEDADKEVVTLDSYMLAARKMLAKRLKTRKAEL